VFDAMEEIIEGLRLYVMLAFNVMVAIGAGELANQGNANAR
jgi:hypothetical protein